MKKIVAAIGGNPNSGKTTIFNELTGSRQKVGNWGGVTVEKKEGKVEYGDYSIVFVDLPGTYSLSAYSMEEILAGRSLTSGNLGGDSETRGKTGEQTGIRVGSHGRLHAAHNSTACLGGNTRVPRRRHSILLPGVRGRPFRGASRG